MEWSSNFCGIQFQWRQLLEEWQNTMVKPYAVQALLTNLKNACDPSIENSPYLDQFLVYLNAKEEVEGVQWFLYETIQFGWFQGIKRFDFIKGALNLLSMDSYFPVFPGSPMKRQTIRQYLMENLSSIEKEFLNLTDTPPRIYTKLEIRMIRNMIDTKHDDILTVQKHHSDSNFSIKYHDSHGNVKMHKVATEKEVLQTIRYTFHFLLMDQEPFQSLQISFPCLPSILVNISDLSSHKRDSIYDALEMTLERWPSYL